MSKGTVDVNNSIDMLAWKHKNDSVPFDADITGISMSSPNKTLRIEPRNKLQSKGDCSKDRAGYLSSSSLSRHNEERFKDHARRYAKKVQKKKTGGSNRR
eukprot:884578_1